jgi:hypothetical protein
LPTDFAPFVRHVLGKLGKPFLTFDTLPPSATIQGPVASVLPMLQHDGPKPEPMFKIGGDLQRASEIEVKGKQGRIDVRASGGRTSMDGQKTAIREAAMIILSNSIAAMPDAGKALHSRFSFERAISDGVVQLEIGKRSARVKILQELTIADGSKDREGEKCHRKGRIEVRLRHSF